MNWAVLQLLLYAQESRHSFCTGQQNFFIVDMLTQEDALDESRERGLSSIVEATNSAGLKLAIPPVICILQMHPFQFQQLPHSLSPVGAPCLQQPHKGFLFSIANGESRLSPHSSYPSLRKENSFSENNMRATRVVMKPCMQGISLTPTQRD